MIRTFGDDTTADVFHLRDTRKARQLGPEVRAAARRKLAILNVARSLHDLRVPPANRLEALSGKLRGRYSVRVNVQWRIVFAWDGKDAFDVSIRDYH